MTRRLPQRGVGDDANQPLHRSKNPADISNNPTTPLDCWREVDAFKAEVNKLEAVSYRFWMAI